MLYFLILTIQCTDGYKTIHKSTYSRVNDIQEELNQLKKDQTVTLFGHKYCWETKIESYSEEQK